MTDFTADYSIDYGTRHDNEDSLRCQAECWGEIPSTLLINEHDDTCCGDCENIIQTFEGHEPDFEAMRDAARERHPVAQGVEPRSDEQFFRGF